MTSIEAKRPSPRRQLYICLALVLAGVLIVAVSATLVRTTDNSGTNSLATDSHAVSPPGP